MSTQDYPAYETLEDILIANQISVTSAHIHGMMLGILCVGEEDLPLAWQELKTELAPLENLTAEDSVIFESLFSLSASHLKDYSLGVTPLLPDDEAPFQERLSALSQWSEGFLLGIHIGGGMTKILLPLNKVTEILEDFASIKEIAIEEESTEDNEKSLQELIEFLRLGSLLIHAECLQAKNEYENKISQLH